MSELPDYNKITFPENQPVPFEEILPDASPMALDLLRRFLVYPSKQRIPAKEVRTHPSSFPCLAFHPLDCSVKFEPSMTSILYAFVMCCV